MQQLMNTLLNNLILKTAISIVGACCCIFLLSNELSFSNENKYVTVNLDLSVESQKNDKVSNSYIEIIIQFKNPTERAICIPLEYLPSHSLDKSAYYNLFEMGGGRVSYNGVVGHKYGSEVSPKVQIILPNEKIVFSENIEKEYVFGKNTKKYKIYYSSPAYFCDEFNISAEKLPSLEAKVFYISKMIEFNY